jgi:hypothetical protein
VFSSRIE